VDVTEDVTVTYTVRDLLAEIRDDVKDVKHGLSTKVDKADFDRLDLRVGDLERVRWKLVGAAAAIAAAFGAVGFGLERVLA
jgi:hypothetical protein